MVGAGGHAKVVIEILEEAGEVAIAGITDRAAGGGDLLGYKLLGSDGELAALYASGIRHAFPAVGDNATRLRILELLRREGFGLVNAISPRAAVSPRARLGAGVAVMAGAVIQVDAAVGDGAIINTGATVDHDCRIGECAHVAPGANLAGNVRVGAGALLGVGSRVIPRVSIGAWAVVGAGAVVISDVAEGVTVGGIPAARLEERRGAG